jgi:hypothetical protein
MAAGLVRRPLEEDSMRVSSCRTAGAVLAIVPALAGCGMGDRLITGFVNSANHIYTDPTQELAETLGRHPGVPPVTDEMLAVGFDAILRRASAGDPDAVLILYRVAERQRAGAE